MTQLIIDLQAEKSEILKRYRALLRACKETLQKGDKKMIRRAFDLALESHQDMRRKSGEPYIYHPIAVAQIAAEEIGLGTTSIVCALLHDVVEDTDITLEDVEREFGKKAAKIIDGLTKISGVFDYNSSLQAENFRKMLLTLADDVRVILIKLADRLHNMRTMEFMPREKQLKIASETVYLYAPLAHRLGLYAMKSELEDLSMKYTETATYKYIAQRLNEKKTEREKFVKEFIDPIQKILDEQGLAAKVYGRPKSINSIWNKMRKKNIPFEEVYDLFAIRIILDSQIEQEKADCWKAYSIVTDFYRPNPDRLRDWISSPKFNGYESLHTTVMGPKGQWVEVQIRTERMNEIAEKGFAAHWKYKEAPHAESSGLDQWLQKVRELLNNPESNALDFLDDFKMNLFSDEIFIFTPKGALMQLPANATALDFAFEIHSDLGVKCIGAKVNHKLVPLSYQLQNGDQVEIITSNKQTPKEDWLNFVITAKAKSKIKSSLKEEKRKISEEGREILDRKLKSLKIPSTIENINKITHFFKLHASQDFLYQIAKGGIDIGDLKEYVNFEKNAGYKPFERTDPAEFVKKIKSEEDTLLIGEDLQKIDYKLSTCCNPIPGDDVFGFVTVGEGIKIHRTSCPNATKLMSNFGYRIVKARWNSQKQLAFLTGLNITGIDDVGLINKITTIISNDFKVNMRSITVDSHEGIFDGSIMVYVNDTHHLNNLIAKLKQVNGVTDVRRFDSDITVEKA
ncbi:MAG: bifunctional (p)ppGpp synthetase/guanosine-3',5'-bis(diphosphate) 3'-pyrophosphohydrolase [Sphingobacteriales bacterium]|nr:bifunctional (p)ppGpp synthetase/guanosine-3',5'-bis(diphosphate) 3'-pyrophosphohydrolase [Sphingobacteriales bacterium]